MAETIISDIKVLFLIIIAIWAILSCYYKWNEYECSMLLTSRMCLFCDNVTLKYFGNEAVRTMGRQGKTAVCLEPGNGENRRQNRAGHRKSGTTGSAGSKGHRQNHYSYGKDDGQSRRRADQGTDRPCGRRRGCPRPVSDYYRRGCFQKLKRYHILLIGMIGMALSPILSLVTQSVVIEEAKILNFDFAAYFNSTIWNSATIFMPIIFTLIGGYIINREYTDHTLKNILPIPISFRRLLTGKLIAMGLLAGALGFYSFVFTALVGVIAGLHGFEPAVFGRGCFQTIGIALCIYIAVLPLIALCGKKPGLFMGGVIVSFILGYSSMFIKGALGRSIYPFLAGFAVIRFDTAIFMNTSGIADFSLGCLSLGAMLLLAAFIVIYQNL